MSSAEEVARLRDCLNDLVSIAALHTRWTDGDPRHIVITLADALLGTLRLAFVLVRLNDPEGGPCIEVVRVAESLQGAPRADCSLASARLGLQGEIGILVAGSERLDFPAEPDRLVLDVAANQATLALLQAYVVAERRRAQQTLRERERESRLVVDSIPGLVALLTAEGDVQFVNRQIVEYTGRALEELRHWGTNDTVHPEDLPHVIQVFTQSIASGSPYEIVQRIRRSDGVYRWFQNNGFPLRGEGGHIVGWCVLLTDVEDRKRAEDALRESEHNLKRLVETIPALVWRSTPEGELDYLNQRAVEYLGHTAEGLAGGRWIELVHPDHRDATVRRWLQSATTGSSYKDVYQLRRADGQYRWIQSVGEPFHDVDGRIAHWYGLVIDIEDRKRAEDELRRSEAFLAQGQRLTLTGSLWWDVSTGKVTWSDETFRILDVPTTITPTVELALSRVHPKDLSLVRQIVDQAAREGANVDLEHRLLMPDGSVKHAHVVLQNVSAQPGKPEFVGAVTDITERKRAEAELRRAYDHLTEAQRLSQTGSFTSDLERDEHYWSDEFYRICEFEPGSEVTLRRLGSIVHPEDAALFEGAIGRAMAGTDRDFYFRIVTPRGIVKHLRGFAHRIADRPVFVGAVQDVTASKMAQEALNRAGAELAHVSRVTTLSALTASIAHEVNQPLAGIITNAGTCLRMLDADPPNIDGARETARRTIRDGNRASEVIVRLRALFSKREFALEPLDLDEAAREVIALSSNDLQRNRIILHSQLAGNLPIVTGDRIQLQQVILNLLRNASDAMADVHDRPRQLLIKTERENGDRVRLTVRDAGVGLSPRTMASLFDAFYTTKSGGMGIGLFVSRSIVERHRGRLWAEPNDGPGATFSFSIPRGPASVSDTADTGRTA